MHLFAKLGSRRWKWWLPGAFLTAMAGPLALAGPAAVTAQPVTAASRTPLQLESITPATVAADQAVEVTIIGTGFTPDTEVTLFAGGPELANRVDLPGGRRLLDATRAGNHVVVVGQQRLWVLETSAPAAPGVVGSVFLPHGGRAVAVSGRFAFVAAGSRFGGGRHLTVVDLFQPDQPVVVANLETCLSQDVAVVGNAVYIPCLEREPKSSILIVDISMPAHPVISGRFPLALRSAVEVDVQGDRAYVLLDELGNKGGRPRVRVACLDVTAPLAPRLVDVSGDVSSEDALRFFLANLAAAGDLIYVGTRSVLETLQADEDCRIRHLGRAPTFREVLDLAVDGPSLYVTSRGIGLGPVFSVYDVGDPTRPRALASVIGLTFRWGQGLPAVDGFVYGANPFLGILEVFDARQPGPTGLLGQVPPERNTPDEILVRDGLAYVADMEGLSVLDVSDAADISVLGRVKMRGGAPRRLEEAGGFVYLAHAPPSRSFALRDLGLQIIDVRRPEHPVVVSPVPVVTGISDVALVGDHAYVVSDRLDLKPGGSDIVVVDISEPRRARIVSRIPVGEFLGRVELIGTDGRLYIIKDSLRIYDLSSPRTPVLASRTGFCFALDLAVSGTTGYLACVDGLQVLDLSIASSPVVVGRRPGIQRVRRLNLAGDDRLYVEGILGGFQRLGHQFIVDVSERRAPHLAGGLPGFGRAFDEGVVFTNGLIGGPQAFKRPPLTSRPMVQDSTRMTFMVPAGFAPGRYHVVAVGPRDLFDLLVNGFQVLP